MYSTTTWDPAIDAEVEYRTQQLSRTYRRGAPAPARALARGVRRLLGHDRARQAARRWGATIDAVAARTDPAAWDREVTRRAAQIADAVDAMRPQDGTGRRAA